MCLPATRTAGLTDLGDLSFTLLAGLILAPLGALSLALALVRAARAVLVMVFLREGMVADVYQGQAGMESPAARSSQSRRQRGRQLRGPLALLLHAVAITHGHRLVLEGGEVDGDAPGRSDLVLTAVELADGAGGVVDGAQAGPAQPVLDRARRLDQPRPLLLEGEHRHPE